MVRILAYLGSFRFLIWLGAVVWVGSVAWAQDNAAAHKDEKIYRYKDRDGRVVYTNLEGAGARGGKLAELDLPELSSVDFDHAQPDELRRLDLRVQEAHSALQSGPHCEAIRKTSRLPMRLRIWDEHGRKIYVAAALLAFSILLGYVGSGRRLGRLLPIPPFLAFGFLVYATVRDVQSGLDTLSSGLRACSEQLPDGEPDSRTGVKGRLEKALDVRNIVNASYAHQEREIADIMREAGR